uniref:Uncharacterized protein n=1 Tax=Haptolina ericina TaxID=156174 RepID=A0A7S3C503_9EUKA|mmetsp:Transcript_9219/g.20724  ORF Transcript_9219/g.20724 Transcript_9219/m.20724 type:complete len:132 (+) Transcript_9219:72-467(+)
MNDLANKRYMETLNKEKEMRRAWAAHDAQKQIFERRSDEFEQLSRMRSTLEGVCGDPAAHVGGDAKPLSRRQQLVGLRNELRSTIATVDAKLDEANNAVEEVDPVVQAARESARQRMKLPLHLRGSAVLNQ